MKTCTILALGLVMLVTLNGCITNTSPSETDITTKHSVGDGKEDFWIGYPSWHPKSGQNIEHPQWVVDTLKKSH